MKMPRNLYELLGCLIPGFRRGVEIFDPLGCHAVLISSRLPTFRDSLFVQLSRMELLDS